MADQILSQEEIDALLSAMDKGEVEFEEEEETGPTAELYDLTTQGAMMRDQFHALEEVYDKFAGLLGTSLSSSFQRSFSVDLVSTEVVRFSEFIQAFSNPTGFAIFNMEPLIGASMLAIEPNLVFSLIDCMFGGGGKPLAEMREFTTIEQRMIRKFSMEVLSNLEKAWETIYKVKINLRKTETKPEFVYLAAPNSLVLNVVYTIAGEEFSGGLHLCISCLMLEPIKEQLSSNYLRDKEIEHTWHNQIKGLLKEIRLNLTAELGRSVHTVSDLLNLQIDDVLRINTGPEDPVVVSVEDVPKFVGVPGVIKGNRAVQITGLHKREGGEPRHG